MLLFVRLACTVAYRGTSAELSVRTIGRSCYSNVYSIELAVNAFTSFTTFIVLPIDSLSSYMLAAGDLVSPTFDTSIGYLVSININSLSFTITHTCPLNITSIGPVSSTE